MENTGRHGYSSRLGQTCQHPAYGPPRRRSGGGAGGIGPAGRRGPAGLALVPDGARPGLGPALVRQCRRRGGDRTCRRTRSWRELHEVEDGLRPRPDACPTPPARSTSISLIFMGKSPPAGRAGRPCRIPGWTDRAFVLRPLADLAPDWRHPVGLPERLDRALPADQVAARPARTTESDRMRLVDTRDVPAVGPCLLLATRV